MSLEHPLLDAPAPRYSGTTVRRAFVVWLYCGQRNHFKDVANYYHRLEQLEEKLPAEQRLKSMQHELNLYFQPPPVSAYLQKHHPDLYTQTNIDNKYMKKIEVIRNESVVLEGLTEARGATKTEIVEASQLIRNYCLEYKVELKDFLLEFQDYTDKNALQSNVSNIGNFIRIKTAIKDSDIAAAFNRLAISIETKEMKDQPLARAVLSEILEPNVEKVQNGDLIQQKKLLTGVTVKESKQEIDDEKENVNDSKNEEVSTKLAAGCSVNGNNGDCGNEILFKTSDENGNMTVESEGLQTQD